MIDTKGRCKKESGTKKWRGGVCAVFNRMGVVRFIERMMLE